MSIEKLVARGPLRQGNEGDAVRAVQLQLAKLGYALHGTGFFGPNTLAMVKLFQAKEGLKVTGEVDAATAAALDWPLIAKTPAAAPADPAMPPWLTKAVSLIGVAEVQGDRDNPVILDWAKACGGAIAKTYKHDSIPWCKMFTEYCLVSTGFRGTDTLWALDNRKVGTALSGPAVGAIATKTRDGGGHTFFVLGKDEHGHIVGVGGNQSDRVCRATFDPAGLKYNWPFGYPVPKKIGIKALPVVDTAPLSKREA